MSVSIGLELGTSVVRAVRLEREGSRIRLAASAQATWSGEDTEHLAAVLKQLRTSLPIKQPVIVGVPTSSSVVTTVRPLVVNRDREALAIQFELQQHLPYDVAEAVWHYRWFATNGRARGAPSPAGQAGSSAIFHPAVVVAMKRPLLMERLAACTRAGLAVQAVEVSGVAIVNAWAQQASDADRAHSALLHLDGPLVEWILVNPSGVHVFTTFRSLEANTQDQWLATLKTSWANLHELFGSKTPGTGAPSATAEQASPPVWLFGGPAALNLLAQDLRRELACNANVLDPSRIVNLESTNPANAQQLVVACGLAMQGLGMAHLPMDLLVEVARQRRAKGLRRAANLVCGLLAILSLVCGARGMLAVTIARQERLAKLSKQEQTYQTLRPQARALLKRQARIDERLIQLEGLTTGRITLIRAFQQIVETLPDDIWLTKVELSKVVPAIGGGAGQPKAPRVEEKPGAGQTMEAVLDGYARSFQSLTQFMDQLRSSVGWATVKPLATAVTTDPTTGKELVGFSVLAQQPLPARSMVGQVGLPTASVSGNDTP